MKVGFIACEYNPFHNGHKYHINKTKEYGADAVVCIMSGNFVQRGSCAIIEKHKRAEMALVSGADLVIELPLRYAIATAEQFAEGFVKCAYATGLDGFISFGAKNSLNEIIELRKIIDSDETKAFVDYSRLKSISYPSALSRFIRENYGEQYSTVLDDANNTLALEYIRARNLFFPEADIFSIKRSGALHNSSLPVNSYSSASYIREFIYSQNSDNKIKDISYLLPDQSFAILSDCIENGYFSDMKLFDRIILALLVAKSPEEISFVNNVNGGLENRIFDCIRGADSLESLYKCVKSKRYTHSRIRQIILSAALGLSRSDYDDEISYIRVLGAGAKGREVLKLMKDTSHVPVIMNLSQIDSGNKVSVKQAEKDYQAGKIFNLCLRNNYAGNPEYEIPPVILE